MAAKEEGPVDGNNQFQLLVDEVIVDR